MSDATVPFALVARPDWQSIVVTHDRRVLLLLLAMGLRLDQAKEVAQATWLRLMEQERDGKLERLEFPGLALKQARFLALDELRRAGRQVALQPIDLDLDSGLPSPETAMIRRQELSRALDAFERCSTSAQNVFRTVYEEPGLSHGEAAVKLGLSVQRVRQVVCEVRKKLRKAIDTAGGER